MFRKLNVPFLLFLAIVVGRVWLNQPNQSPVAEFDPVQTRAMQAFMQPWKSNEIPQVELHPFTAGTLTLTQRQINWRTDLQQAFEDAVFEQKALVVLFSASPDFRSADGRNLSVEERDSLSTAAASILPCETRDALAETIDRSIFVVLHIGPGAEKPVAGSGDDAVARQMFARLKLEVYPTISVIAPTTEQLTEVFRFEGFFQAADIADDLQSNTAKAVSLGKSTDR